jgi:hypothetical protein
MPHPAQPAPSEAFTRYKALRQTTNLPGTASKFLLLRGDGVHHVEQSAGEQSFRDFLCSLPAQENRASRGTLPVILRVSAVLVAPVYSAEERKITTYERQGLYSRLRRAPSGRMLERQ